MPPLAPVWEEFVANLVEDTAPEPTLDASLANLSRMEFKAFMELCGGAIMLDSRGPCLFHLVHITNTETYGLFHRVLGCSACTKPLPESTSKNMSCDMCENAVYCSLDCRYSDLMAHVLQCDYFRQTRTMADYLIRHKPENVFLIYFDDSVSIV